MVIYYRPVAPDYEAITEKAQLKMEQRFPKYGNSWIGCFNWEYWNIRLHEELKEVEEAKDSGTKQEEILDVINILCMIYENIGAMEASTKK